MIIIGGEQSPEERVKLDAVDVDSVEYYAKNAVAVSVQDAIGVRVPDYVPWPVLEVTPTDARGYYVYSAVWDERYLDIDYANRRVKLKKVGNTSVSFDVENADGTVISVVWNLEILDKLAALSVTIDPSQDESHDIFSALRITANIDGGDYPYTFNWYLNNKLFRTRATVDPTDKTDYVNISSLQWTDEGVYKVTATDRNGVTAATSTFKLTIIPQEIVIDGMDETFRVRQGLNWSDTFTFVGGKPPFRFMWKHDGSDTQYTQQQITIQSVQPSDVGEYKLQITDALGTVKLSPAAYTLYVMEYLLRATARSQAAADTSTITNGGRDVLVNMDLNDPRDTTYNLLANRFDNGNAVTVGPWSSTYTGPVVSTNKIGTDNATLQIKPLQVGSASFKIYTDDNRSDSLNVTANVTALPHLDSPLVMPELVYVGSQTTQPTENVTPNVRASAVPETYKWERKNPGENWQTIATTKTLAATPINSSIYDGALFRFTITNAYSSAVSNEVAVPFRTFDAMTIVRKDSYNNDEWIPGGIYPVEPGAVSPYNTRALGLSATSLSYAMRNASSDITIQQTGQNATVTVADTAPAATNTLDLTATNTTGTPDAVYKASTAANVVRPSVSAVNSSTAVVGIEIQVAQMNIPIAYTRGPDFNVVIEPGVAGALTSRYNSGRLFATGVTVEDTLDTNIVVYYNAPGSSVKRSIKLPFAMAIRDVFTLQAGISTAGDAVTAYVDSQNKIK